MVAAVFFALFDNPDSFFCITGFTKKTPVELTLPGIKSGCIFRPTGASEVHFFPKKIPGRTLTSVLDAGHCLFKHWKIYQIMISNYHMAMWIPTISGTTGPYG